MVRRKTKNKLIHRWVEPQCEKIQESFIADNLSELLGEGSKPSKSKYTHQQITDWCRRWLVEVINDRMEAPEPVYDIIQDIDAQWDLYLFNSYTYEDLIKLDLSQIRLPLEWFVEWSNKLKDFTEHPHSQGCS
jgi:hypothetical protein